MSMIPITQTIPDMDIDTTEQQLQYLRSLPRCECAPNLSSSDTCSASVNCRHFPHSVDSEPYKAIVRSESLSFALAEQASRDPLSRGYQSCRTRMESAAVTTEIPADTEYEEQVRRNMAEDTFKLFENDAEREEAVAAESARRRRWEDEQAAARALSEDGTTVEGSAVQRDVVKMEARMSRTRRS